MKIKINNEKMKIPKIKTILVHIYLSGFLSLFITHADMWLAKRELLNTQPTLLFLLLSLPIVIFIFFTKLSSLLEIYSKNILVILPFCLLVISSLYGGFLSFSNEGDQYKYVFLFIYDFLVVLIAMSFPLLKSIRENFRRYIIIALVVLVATIFIDSVIPGFFSKQISRTAGFAENANASAFLVNILCALSISYKNVKAKDILIITMSAVAISTTLSRSGILIFTCLILYMILVNIKYLKFTRILFTCLLFISLSFPIYLGTGLVFKKSQVFQNSASQNRLDMLSGKKSLVASNEERVILLEEYWRLTGEKPILGHGTGFTYTLPIGPHNMYLQQWVNNGLLGLVSYLLLIVSSMIMFYFRKNYSGLVLIILVALYSFFSHNIIDYRSFLILLGMITTLSITQKKCVRKVKKY